jgi:hypothetical protein
VAISLSFYRITYSPPL